MWPSPAARSPNQPGSPPRCLAEPLLVGLRPGHHLASRDTIALSELGHEVLGTPAGPVPGLALTQRQALEAAGIARQAIGSPTLTWQPSAGPTSRH